MSISPYEASVPVLQQLLGAMGRILEKAEADAATRKYDPSALLQARLYPDMFAFAKQVQVACDFARGMSARLAGVDVPSNDDKEQSLADLRALIGRTLEFLGGLDPSRFEGSETREIVLRPGTPKERRLDGKAYLLTYALPQFYFHLTTAYALLRHNGVAIGKKDYLGAS